MQNKQGIWYLSCWAPLGQPDRWWFFPTWTLRFGFYLTAITWEALLNMNKTEARDLISKGFKSLPASVISLHQRAHLDLLKSLIQEHNFSHVASYVSLQNEVSTEKINKFLLNSKIKLYLPKIDPKKNVLDFVLCEKKLNLKRTLWEF